MKINQIIMKIVYLEPFGNTQTWPKPSNMNEKPNLNEHVGFERRSDPVSKDSMIPYYQIPFHIFLRYWSHIQDFQDFIRRVVGICRRPSFPKCPKCHFAIFKNNISGNDLGFFLHELEDFGLSKNKNKRFWGSETRPKIPKS